MEEPAEEAEEEEEEEEDAEEVLFGGLEGLWV